MLRRSGKDLPGATSSYWQQPLLSLDSQEESTLWERIVQWVNNLFRLPELRQALQLGQFAASLMFVVLYVWSTYSTPAPFSARYNLDLFLCFVFAVDYAFRFWEAESKTRMLVSVWNVLDILAFAPPLLEALLMHGANVPFKLGRFDFRWFKILRALRVMRISLLAGELQTMHLSSSGALLSGAASVRLFQLVASVLTLLFTTSSIVHLVERIAWHDALYFVTTTLTTVGYGDVVAVSSIGKFAVLAMICVGVVVIPVQTSQVYSQLAARRVTLGALPDKGMHTVLVSTSLTEVRGFSDFFSEFFKALEESTLPKRLRMLVLGNKPSFEFRAFQELNEKKITIIEGSALSERDLQRVRAESTGACLLMADRFSEEAKQEDLNIQFQVWAMKSYTKSVPLYVQVLQRSSLQLIAPFLDAEQDVIVSIEQTRHRLLALSCLCPGASTLIANLLRQAAILPRDARRKTAAGRRWLRSYVNGCAYKICQAPLGPSLTGVSFVAAAEWLYRSSGFVLIGIVRKKDVMLNPGRQLLGDQETAIVIGTSQLAVEAAVTAPFWAPRPIKSAAIEAEIAKTQHEAVQDDDDYFFVDEDGTPCVPLTPAQIYSESDASALDVDDMPCIPMEAHMAADPDPDEYRDDMERLQRMQDKVRQQLEAEAPPFPLQQKMVEGYSSMHYCVTDEADARDRGAEVSTSGRALVEERSDWMAGRGLMDPSRHRGRQQRQQQQEQQQQQQREQPDAGTSRSFTGNGSTGGRPAGDDLDSNSADPGAHKAEAQREGASHLQGPPEAQGKAGPPAERDEVASIKQIVSELATREADGDAKGTAALGELSKHVIVCGAEESFLNFVEQLRRSDPMQSPVVILHPTRPMRAWPQLQALGPVFFVRGDPSDSASLRAARASAASSLVFLADLHRPAKGSLYGSVGAADPDSTEASSKTSRAAVLADAEALLTCYGVGEEKGGNLLHAVVELCFTSSVRFLQPGLLLKGTYTGEDYGGKGLGEPRKSWLMRKRQERAAVKEGLAEWQANPYFCAGRVTVPALMDTFACKCFFNQGMLTELMTELCGDDGRPGGALLRQIDMPPELANRTYGELFLQLSLQRKLIPLGLYRRKSENPAWRLHYVVTNPSWHERLEPYDRIFVLRERGGSWLTSSMNE
ncbi:hypothetical protein WJX72_007481 [[Myrmecia] bisecta]|uniref:Uncharacterized protein n=1 Tax=[Myrmecia] bisecta TaxID=41462 RepID=A0AAW1PGQ8_9CHLO